MKLRRIEFDAERRRDSGPKPAHSTGRSETRTSHAPSCLSCCGECGRDTCVGQLPQGGGRRRWAEAPSCSHAPPAVECVVVTRASGSFHRAEGGAGGRVAQSRGHATHAPLRPPLWKECDLRAITTGGGWRRRAECAVMRSCALTPSAVEWATGRWRQKRSPIT